MSVPGAAGTVSLLKSTPPHNLFHPYVEWLSYIPLLSLEHTFYFLSWLGLFSGICGSMLCGWSLGRKRGMVGCGIIAAFWVAIHDYGIVIGPDPWAFGLSWLAVGLRNPGDRKPN